PIDGGRSSDQGGHYRVQSVVAADTQANERISDSEFGFSAIDNCAQQPTPSDSVLPTFVASALRPQIRSATAGYTSTTLPEPSRATESAFSASRVNSAAARMAGIAILSDETLSGHRLVRS